MATQGTVTASSLNLRSAPNGNVIKQLAQGTTVDILEDQGDWLKVNAGDQEGFVSSKYIQQESAESEEGAATGETAEAASQPEKGTVTASSLNLRSSPGGDVIAQLQQGSSVDIIEDQGEWLKVSANGQEGFASAKYIQRGDSSTPSPKSTSSGGQFRFVGNSAVAPDGTKFATKFKLGVYNYGTTSIGDFVSAKPDRFAAVSPSRLRVMQAVSANEGKLEAINTWDNAFLTFGIFQWIVGVGDGAGELASLIDRLKTTDQAVFQNFFGQYGLDATVTNSQPGTTPVGYFSLNGVRLKSASQKEQMRTLEWAYNFWLAGHDDTVRQVEIDHAMGRVDIFYRSDKHKIGGRFIADYVTSEFGVALLLDQHVNRPGHVPQTIAKAVSQVGGGDPGNWGDAEEKRLLDTYITLRAQTSMTDSTKRADTIRKAVSAGLASDKRGSYQP